MEKTKNMQTFSQQSMAKYLAKFKEIARKKAKLNAEEKDIIQAFELAMQIIASVEKKKPSELPLLRGGNVLIHTSGSNARIGDAMEAILQERGSLTTREIIESLKARNIRLSEKNPRIVISMTIKQDKKQRFIRDKENKISLRK